MSIPEESDGDETDDQSYRSEVGIIDGVRPAPTKMDIVNQWRRAPSRELGSNQAAEQNLNQGGSTSAMGKNQVEVWNGRKSQEQAAH